MRPVFSVILFTVLSGAGYGIFITCGLMDLFHSDVDWSRSNKITLMLTAYILVTIGLLSSALHLANPKNAWRSFSRFKTSWLSREAVLAIAFYPVSFFWAYLWAFDYQSSLTAILVIALAIMIVYCTGMIYACLRTIKAWNTHYTPLNYILLSLMSGSILVFTVNQFFASNSTHLILFSQVFLLAAILGKALYYIFLGKLPKNKPETAFALGTGNVNLLDTGHTSDNFITREFGYLVSINKTFTLKAMFFIGAFLLPFFMLLTHKPGSWLCGIASLIMLTAIVIERWLFFAEARHSINNYYK